MRNPLNGKRKNEGFWRRCGSSNRRKIPSALDRIRILELANKAHSPYVTQNSQEKAKLLRMVLSNCAVDAVSVYPTYRKPFDMIFERAKTGDWWAWGESNSRHAV